MIGALCILLAVYLLGRGLWLIGLDIAWLYRDVKGLPQPVPKPKDSLHLSWWTLVDLYNEERAKQKNSENLPR